MPMADECTFMVRPPRATCCCNGMASTRYKIPSAADRNPDKVGALTLGTGIRIISEAQSRRMRPDYYLVLPWHFKKEFLTSERATIQNGTSMIFPLPDITVVNSANLEAEIAKADITGNMLEDACI